jgi:hypothetical protein
MFGITKGVSSFDRWITEVFLSGFINRTKYRNWEVKQARFAALAKVSLAS